MGIFVPALDYLAPGGLEEAIAVLGQNPEARLLAGGHDLIPDLKAGRKTTSMLVDLRKLAELRTIALDHGSGTVRIGAMATLNDILTHPELGTHLRVLAQCAGSVGDAQVRNLSTVGGTLASLHPASDLAAAMLALDASVEAEGPSGRRRFGSEEFLTAPGLPIGPDEVITAVEVAMTPGSGGAYVKVRNPANLYPIAGVAAWIARTGNNLVGRCRIAVVGVFERPLRAHNVESAIEGTRPSVSTLAAAAARIGEGAAAVGDLAASGAYRLHLASVLAHEALIRAAEDTGLAVD